MDSMETVKILKALADANRLHILELLGSGEQCACVLLGNLDLSQPTLSHHMKILCDAGLVTSRKAGKWIYYRDPRQDRRLPPGTRPHNADR